MRVYYFGCSNRESGHYLIESVDWSHSLRAEKIGVPWGWNIDGALCPGMVEKRGRWDHGPDSPGEVEGLAQLHHKDGWTALAFWDRSVDHRYGSNSVFLADVTLTFDQMVAQAQKDFPDIWARYKFPIREWNTPKRTRQP